jgi:hypothetical protein
MTLQKHMPLVLMIFALVSILPAAMVPSAFAQEEDDDDENLSSSIVSDVLEDGSSDAEDESNQDSTNTATINPNQEQDLDQTDFNVFGDETADLIQDERQANVAVPLAIPIDIDVIEKETPITPTPPEEEEPPEFVVFCFEGKLAGFQGLLCFESLEDCEEAHVIAEETSECEGFETLPPDAADCEIFRDEEGEIAGLVCALPATNTQ